jgi:acyl carrier protein
MDESVLWEQLTEVFQETFDDPDIALARETTAGDVEGWDSVSNIRLLVTAEQVFGVKFRTGEIAGLANVGELFDLIAARVRA